jgi:hypothetical protein
MEHAATGEVAAPSKRRKNRGYSPTSQTRCAAASPLRGLSIDEREDVRNIAHAGFTEGQRGDGDRQ